MGSTHNKYSNIPTRGFDSKKEARRWQELQILQRAGKISDLRRQVPFQLVPAQYVNGKCVERAVKYVADFVYTENGEQIVEDVKGYKDGNAYRIFAIKRKLMLWIHGITLRET